MTNNDNDKENYMDNNERMQWALEDIEKYAFQILEGAEALTALVDALSDVPEAEQMLTATKTMQKAYHTIANDLLRNTNRGLGKKDGGV